MGVHRGFFALFFLLLLWFSGKFLLPFLFPFLLGAGLALASEPAVILLHRRLRIPRGLSAGLGVSLTLILLLGIIFFLGALLVREAGSFASRIPEAAQQSADLLEGYLTDLSARVPEPVGPVLSSSVHRFFRNRAALADRAIEKAPGFLTGLLGKASGSADASTI